MTRDKCNYDKTRTAVATGPLVLESGGSVFVCCLFVFLSSTNHYHNQWVNIYYHTNYFNFFKFYHTFYYTIYHTFYHKLQPQTMIIIGGSISTTTPIFFPIRQFFNFTTKFTTNHYHYPYPTPKIFLYLRETCKDFEGVAKIWQQLSRRRKRSTDNLVLGF